MEVPSDSVLAVSTRSKQEAERKEQQQLKRLVLNYEEREAAAARQGKNHNDIFFRVGKFTFIYFSCC